MSAHENTTMPPLEGPPVYEFGDFRLDAEQRQLVLKADGGVLPLASRAFDTLLYLVQHPAELVSRTALMDAVWPGTIVEENNLSQSIAAIRRVLGEKPGEHKYIVTIAGRGFRFVAPVTTALKPEVQAPVTVTPPIAAPASPPQKRGNTNRGINRRRLFGVVGLIVVVLAVAAFLIRQPQAQLPGTHTLAILPFKSVAPSDDNESLQYGMADALISGLKDLKGISVQPFSSVRRYGRPEQDAVAAARELGVASVLDGTIQRSGERLRVTARLMSAADGRQLWSGQFQENFTDIFAVQDAIAAKVTDALAIRLSGQVQQRLTRRYTDDAEAYQLYVNGWFQRNKTDEAGYTRSIDFFKQAIARDPDYPLPYVGLADSYAMLGVFGARAPEKVFPEALAAVSKALQIDGNLGAAHASLAHIKFQYERDQPGAEREYLRAIDLAPDYALAHMLYGVCLAQTGRLDDALSRLKLAQQLEPLLLGTSANIGMIHYYARRYDEAIKQLRKVLEVAPTMDHARSFLGRALMRKGDYGAAIGEFERRGSLSVGSYADLGTAYALSGRRQDAQAELNRLLALAREHYVSAYDIAAVHASLGNADQAFQWLDQAIAERAPLLGFFHLDPSFDALRGDLRMTPLLAQLRAPSVSKVATHTPSSL